MNSLLDKDKIKESLTTDDIIEILTELGSSNPIWSSDKQDLRFLTKCHDGDGYNLTYHSNSQNFYCYSNCGSMDIFQLVQNVKEAQGVRLNFPETVKWVAELTKKKFTIDRDNIGISISKIEDWDWIHKVTRKKPVMSKELKTVNENVLEVFLSYRNNWVDEGITPDVAKLYEVGYYLKEDQITLPVRNENGELVGIRSRNTDERVGLGMKYIPTKVSGKMYNYLNMYNCYGLHLTKDTIKKHKRIYIFEGEKSCMKSQLFYKNDNFSIAVQGSNVSDWQVKKILSLGVEDVILAFDKFRAQKENESDRVYERFYEDYKRKLARIGHKFAPYVRFYVLWDENNLLQSKDSPIDRGKEVFELLTENKIEIKTKDVVLE